MLTTFICAAVRSFTASIWPVMAAPHAAMKMKIDSKMPTMRCIALTPSTRHSLDTIQQPPTEPVALAHPHSLTAPCPACKASSLSPSGHRLGQDSIHRRGQNYPIIGTGMRNKPV
jgi:hypothetical protein